MNPLADDTIPTARQLWSTGKICELLQMSPDQLDAMRRHCGVEFAVVVDGCGYIDGESLTAMFEECKRIADAVAQRN